MPTSRPRHTITETPRVAEALDALRRATGDDDLTLPELLILGARTRLAEIAAAGRGRERAYRSVADRVRAGGPTGDVAAADEVRRSGWVRD